MTPSAAGREGFATAEAAMDLLPTAWSAAKRDDDISATAAAARFTFTEVEEAESPSVSVTAQAGNMDEQLKVVENGNKAFLRLENFK